MTASPLRRSTRALAFVLAAALVVAACGVEAGKQSAATKTRTKKTGIVGSDVEPTSTTASTTTTLPPVDIEINGSNGGHLDDVIGNAIVDLQAFWKQQFPKAYQEPYKPITGGLYAIDSNTDPTSLPCSAGPDIQQMLDNAFYCPPDDAVVWDQERFMPDLAKRYGDFTVALIIAHEWGHLIQDRAQFEAPSVITELQADCFAGSWVKHVAAGETSRFKITNEDLDQALAGVLSLRDAPGGTADDPSAHGSGFDRVGAFQDGFESGATRCAEYRNGDPTPYQFPFSDQADADNNGDLPLSGPASDDDIVDLTFPSLKAYWTDTFPALADGKKWDPLGDPVAFTPNDPPDCGGDSAKGYLLFVCIPDRYVGYEAKETIPAAYDQNGDFAVATLFATQYGLDVVNQLGSASDEVTATLQGDCFAGAWAAALLPPSPPDRYQLILSPGDLDEGVSVLLSFRSDEDRKRQGPGFDRVRAFRRGVIKGPDSCTDIKAN